MATEEYSVGFDQGYEDGRSHFTQNPWQPIRTAPKDSEYRLFYKRGTIHEARWLGEGRGFGGDHWGFDFPSNIARGYDNQPSHWMPLPQPPREF